MLDNKMTRSENGCFTPGKMTDDEFDFALDKMIGEAAAYLDEHPDERANLARRFFPFWEVLTHGYDATYTEVMLMTMEQKLPKLSRKEIITALKADFGRVRNSAASLNESSASVEGWPTPEQIASYWDYLNALEVEENLRETKALTSDSDDVHRLEPNVRALAAGLSELLSDYFIVPGGLSGDTADYVLAYFIRFGALPKECRGQKIIFRNEKRGDLTNAVYFAKEFFRSNAINIFNSCVNTGTEKGIDDGNLSGKRRKPNAPTPEFLKNERLQAFIRACKDAYNSTEI